MAYATLRVKVIKIIPNLYANMEGFRRAGHICKLANFFFVLLFLIYFSSVDNLFIICKY